MASQISAGLLMFSRKDGELRVLLVHPGGPFFAKKDAGYWSIPKGLVAGHESFLETARREFAEETGLDPPHSGFIPLDSVIQKGGKVVHGWAFEGEWQDGRVPASNTFKMQWPPRSGRLQEFPEIDRAELFTLPDARSKINERQLPFLDRLVAALGTVH